MPKQARTGPSTTIGEPIGKIKNGLVGLRLGRPDSEEQHRAVVVNACLIQALAEQLSDVLAGTQDVGNDQLERQ